MTSRCRSSCFGEVLVVSSDNIAVPVDHSIAHTSADWLVAGLGYPGVVSGLQWWWGFASVFSLGVVGCLGCRVHYGHLAVGQTEQSLLSLSHGHISMVGGRNANQPSAGLEPKPPGRSRPRRARAGGRIACRGRWVVMDPAGPRPGPGHPEAQLPLVLQWPARLSVGPAPCGARRTR